jgi:CBS domain containing-hemolysin-like protein
VTPEFALLLVLVLIAANALFVAAEFALVSTSRGILEERADQGDRGARRAIALLGNLSFILSACQFGITATSLLVGFLAEDAIGDVVVRPVVRALSLPDATATTISIGAAFFLSTMFQMVVGELAPKNLAIARPEGTSAATSLPMRVFGVVFGPIIRVFDAAAAWLTRRVFRVEVTEELAGGLSLDELSRIIEASGKDGTLSDQQADLLGRAVSLGDLRAVEVMIPRPDITWLAADEPVSSLRTRSRDSGHSRFPVRDGEKVVGSVHVKDLLRVPTDDHETVTVGEVATSVLLVPEGETLRRLLLRFRNESRTFGLVVDEYGSSIGLVTMEDVLEQLVGRIEDEFDPRQVPMVRRLGGGRLLLSGRLPVVRVPELLGGRELPDGDYDTVAGFVIHELGRIPDRGDEFEAAGLHWHVTRMADQRIAEVRVRPLDDEVGEPLTPPGTRPDPPGTDSESTGAPAAPSREETP